jgi:hypothetical protein
VTAVERYHQQLREIGCIACLMTGEGPTPPEIHHLFDAHERNDWLVCPLCRPHHQRTRRDIVSFHPGGERPFRAAYGFGEKEMLAETIKRHAETRR